MEDYDVVIAGGSISGLTSAREIAKKGYTALVLEEGFEVGTPDHCGGLVSKSASVSYTHLTLPTNREV